MTTKTIKECLDIEKFTPIFKIGCNSYVPLRCSRVDTTRVWSDGWMAGRTTTERSAWLSMEDFSHVIPRELML